MKKPVSAETRRRISQRTMAAMDDPVVRKLISSATREGMRKQAERTAAELLALRQAWDAAGRTAQKQFVLELVAAALVPTGGFT